MKIFMVHEDPWHAGNPYISSLIDELKRQYPQGEVAWGRDSFWNENIFSFDVVHFHWPYTFMANDSHTIDEFEVHVHRLKACGVRIVATCHDLESHYNQFSKYEKTISIVYSQADVIIHLGDYSRGLLASQYPNASHVVVPHHLYDTRYNFFPTREESLRFLGLPDGKTYILCFGAFRGRAEQQLILSLSKQLNDKNIEILAPGFMYLGSRRFILKWCWNKLRKWYYQKRYHIHCSGWTFAPVSDKRLPYFYGVADVAFIQRVKILNSGNAVMPMLFGKVVVGPDVGNVGELLRKWHYPVFDVNKPETAAGCVSKGLELSRAGYGEKIREAQMKEYSTEETVRKLYAVYSRA